MWLGRTLNVVQTALRTGSVSSRVMASRFLDATLLWRWIVRMRCWMSKWAAEPHGGPDVIRAILSEVLSISSSTSMVQTSELLWPR